MIKLKEVDIECENCKKVTKADDMCFVFLHWEKVNGNRVRLDKRRCKLYCTECQNISNPYWIGLLDREDNSGFFDSPEETIDTMCHLMEKGWLDVEGFVEKWKKLRKFSPTKE